MWEDNNTIYFARDWQFNPPHSALPQITSTITYNFNVIKFTLSQAHTLCKELAGIEGGAESIQELEAEGPFMEFIRVHKPAVLTCRLAFSKEKVQALCNIMHKPYVKLAVGVFSPPNLNEEIPCEGRVYLTDILAKLNKYPRHCHDVLTIPDYRHKTMLCDIILGWSDPEPKPTPIQLSPGTFMERLFHNEATKDLAIIAGDGTRVKCHKNIFEAQSDALAAMLSSSSGMQEAETGMVHMKENSGEGVTLLIEYFYGMELTDEKLTSPSVAVELFKMADKYLLTQLQECMGQFLLGRTDVYFTVEAKLELYFHSQNLADWNNLEEHSFNMIRSSIEEVQNCDLFKEIEVEEPAEVIKLFRKLLSKEKEQSKRSMPKRKRR